MAVGVFPAVKLGVLFMKQISKPLAKLIVEQAKNHPVFRNYIIIPPAQFYHWAEVKAKMYLMNLGKPEKVPKLNEQMAIELGASLIGEVIIFSIAGGCIVFEYQRQSQKETKKEAARQAQIEKFTSDIQALFETTIEQEKQIKYLNNAVEEMAKNPKQKINLEEIKKSTNPPDSGRDSDKNNPKYSESSTDDKSVVHRAIGYFEKDVKGKDVKPS